MILNATVVNIIYRNETNGWTVAALSTDENDRITAVGIMPLLTTGEQIECSGDYIIHQRFGRQFKVDSYHTVLPQSANAIEAYLGSGIIRGIGPSTAKAIVSAFGDDTLRILDEEPSRLKEVAGIGAKRAMMIADSYRETRDMRDILLALEPYGITVSQAQKLYAIYGPGCIERLIEDPYQLIYDVEGIGFITADRIAQNIDGYSETSLSRLKAGIIYALNDALNEKGHTFLPRQNLLSFAHELLHTDIDVLEEALDAMISSKEVRYSMVGEIDGIFLPRIFRLEKEIADRLIDLKNSVTPNPFIEALANMPGNDIRLSPKQAEAVRLALKEGILVITGGPGTGKTTIIRTITGILSRMQMEYALCAPTGRAAKRMSDATGEEAKTLHRLLEFVPGQGFMRDEDNPLMYDMIVIDEMSMVDVPLFSSFLRAVPSGTRLVLVGDSDQLPSVGPGDVLKDIISSEAITTIRLTEIYRQAETSRIVTNAHLINNGQMPVLDTEPGSDFSYVEMPDITETLDYLLSAYANGSQILSNEPLMDVQVLVPMKKGTLGVLNINKQLQELVNPASPEKNEHIFGDTVFRVGDKVMQVKNDYKVEWTKRGPHGSEISGTGSFNGDLGTLYRIDPALKRFSVLYDDDRLAHFDFSQFEEIDLAYCISIHKSQGSEFPIVILPLFGGPPILLSRNLLYTAVTRARDKVICIGDRATIRQMVTNNRDSKRFTSLSVRLIEAIK